jgi:hypothetical protein
MIYLSVDPLSHTPPATPFISFSAEVLHYTGVLEDIPSLSEEQNEMFLKIKGEAMRYAENFRVQVRRRLDPKRMRVVMEKERSATLGLASGAVLGFVL